jgi:uncharacterized protein YbaP (TraB family)
MKQRSCSYVLPILFMLAGAGHAQQQQAQPAPKPHHVLLWKATSPTTTAYLVGSIHVGDDKLYPLPPAVESAFAAAKILIVEVNTKALDQTKGMELVGKYGVYGGDDNLYKHINKQTADALDAYCSANGLPRQGLESLKPWVVAVTVLAMSLKKAGEDPNLGIDMHFLNASQAPQRIAELETAEFQLSLLASATDQEQQEMLAATLKRAANAKEYLEKMRDAYLAGDSNTLLNLIHDQESGPASLMKKLVDDRNITMTATLEQYLKGKEPCFVVVGAAHLLGDNGIVKLLQSKGYRVELVGTGAP